MGTDSSAREREKQQRLPIYGRKGGHRRQRRGGECHMGTGKKTKKNADGDIKNTQKKRLDITGILLVITLIVAVTASAVFLVLCRQNGKSEDEYGSIQSAYTGNGNSGDNGNAKVDDIKGGGAVKKDRTAAASANVDSHPIPDAPSVDFKGLKEKGRDIVAWISVPSMGIEYPVVQTDNNEDYLHTTAFGSNYYAGSIILEAVNSPAFTDVNTILYGHNMSNGSMFGSLARLQEDVPDGPVYIWICTPDAGYLYRVFSEYVTDMHSDAYRMFGTKDTSADAAKWISEISGKSKVPFEMPPTYIKRVLTLSTCTSASDNTRRVVHAVMMKRQVKTSQ